jgi:hypothetical protein
MIFEITPENSQKLQDWLYNEVYPEIIQKQKETIKEPNMFHQMGWEDGVPYQGAIGGGLTYSFTPTSLGTVLKVQYITHSKTYELDLTEYEDW